MPEYKMTIGLEIHAELKTKSKMFCGCANSEDLSASLRTGSNKAPNIHICPICMGYPGTLPVINKEAVRKVLLVGTALGGKIADFTEFDRKNYFYPDIPKGYQISQYKYPLVSGGELNGVKLTRIHLEEDTARSTHDSSPRGPLGENYSLVDYNRAGVPLMELVTEPSLHSSEEAVSFAKELQLVLQYLAVSDANMEKGEMRVEANISVAKGFPTLGESEGTPTPSERKPLGTKVEVKNLNSFRAVGKAIEFEFKRQVALLEKGEKVNQETRGWDENKQVTFSQRTKESAHDYRYFPEPDLPKLQLSEIKEFSKEELEKFLVELPQEKRNRYAKDFGLKKEDIEVYINNKETDKFFGEVVKNFITLGERDFKTLGERDFKTLGERGVPPTPSVGGGEKIKIASNYITSDIIGLSKSIGVDFTLGQITTNSFVKLIVMVISKQLSSRGAKDTLKIMFDDGGDPEIISKEKGLIQKSDEGEIKKIMEEIISKNPDSVVMYKNGKESILQFFVGLGMKTMKGSGNPEVIKKVILELLTK